MKRFGLTVPTTVFGVDPEILRPINIWADKELYTKNAKKLAEKFVKNFERYEKGVPADVVKRGGPDLSF